MSPWRAASFGVWGVLLALGCGGRSEDGAAPAQTEPELPAPGALGEMSPDMAEGSLDEPLSPAPRQDTEPEPEPPAPAKTSRELAQEAAEDVLGTFCGECHGAEAIANDNVQGGIGYIEDLDQLVATGKIIPLSAADSLVVKVMLDGSMPPSGVLPRPAQQDIRLVMQFIDLPIFF